MLICLDVNMSKDKNGCIQTSVHEKNTNCHQYIEYSSCHPMSCKANIPFSQAKRYRRITSNNDTYTKELTHLNDIFLARNYPKEVIDKALKKRQCYLWKMH